MIVQMFIRIMFGLALLAAAATVVCVIGFVYEISRVPGGELAGAGWALVVMYPFGAAVLAGMVASVLWVIERASSR